MFACRSWNALRHVKLSSEACSLFMRPPRTGFSTAAALEQEVMVEEPEDSPDPGARIPLSIQANYYKPLRREAIYGLPVCDLQLRSYSVRNLEFMCDFALRAAYYAGLPASGPVPLPKKIERWTVPRSNFVHKKSQENFERITRKRLIQIKDGHPETVELWLAFLKEHQYHGVGMKANVWGFDELGIGKRMNVSLETLRKVSRPVWAHFGPRKTVDTAEEARKILNSETYKDAVTFDPMASAATEATRESEPETTAQTSEEADIKTQTLKKGLFESQAEITGESEPGENAQTGKEADIKADASRGEFLEGQEIKAEPGTITQIGGGEVLSEEDVKAKAPEGVLLERKEIEAEAAGTNTQIGEGEALLAADTKAEALKGLLEGQEIEAEAVEKAMQTGEGEEAYIKAKASEEVLLDSQEIEAGREAFPEVDTKAKAPEKGPLEGGKEREAEESLQASETKTEPGARETNEVELKEAVGDSGPERKDK